MALLRDDRLVDADQAISELRKQAIGGRSGRKNQSWRKLKRGEDAKPRAAEVALGGAVGGAVEPMSLGGRSPRTHASAGLALVELYRDVITGHPTEALDSVQDKLPTLRTQLGHRVADIYVLLARAYDQLNKADDAARLYADATLMAPAGSCTADFPETAVLAERYRRQLRRRWFKSQLN